MLCLRLCAVGGLGVSQLPFEGSEGLLLELHLRPRFFYPILLGALCRRTDVRFLHSSSSRQYVTASVPIYRFFRSGGNTVRRLRTVRSACLRNVSRTGSGVMRSCRFPVVPVSRTLCLVCGDFSAPIPLSFRRTILHGVPVFPDLCVY